VGPLVLSTTFVQATYKRYVELSISLVCVRWVSASSGLVCLLLYLPLVFRESYISHRELDYIKTTSSKADKVWTKGWDTKKTGPEFLNF
jgi:hypothetical protein